MLQTNSSHKSEACQQSQRLRLNHQRLPKSFIVPSRPDRLALNVKVFPSVCLEKHGVVGINCATSDFLENEGLELTLIVPVDENSISLDVQILAGVSSQVDESPEKMARPPWFSMMMVCQAPLSFHLARTRVPSTSICLLVCARKKTLRPDQRPLTSSFSILMNCQSPHSGQKAYNLPSCACT